MHILAQMGGFMLPPDEPSLESIERNRRWNREERRKIARSLMDETIETIVSVMEFSRHPIREQFEHEIEAIEQLAVVVNQYPEEDIHRWVRVLAAEKRRSGQVL